MKQEGKKILLVCCDLYFICSVTDPALSNYFRLNTLNTGESKIPLDQSRAYSI